jgi:hypothetical protein
VLPLPEGVKYKYKNKYEYNNEFKTKNKYKVQAAPPLVQEVE